MKTLLSILGIIYILSWFVRCFAADVKLAWDANPETDISAYELSYSLESGKYDFKNSTNLTEYTISELVEGETYFFSVRAKNTQGLVSPPSNEIVYTIPKASPKGWVVKYVDDEQSDGYSADLAIDNDPNTFWHTVWREGQPQTPLPHSLEIDMGYIKNIKGFSYLPRQDIFSDGEIKNYEFLLSLDGIEWNSVSKGEFQKGKQLTTINFPAKNARYFKIIANTNYDNTNYTSIAELDVIESETNLAPSVPKSFRVVIEIKLK